MQGHQGLPISAKKFAVLAGFLQALADNAFRLLNISQHHPCPGQHGNIFGIIRLKPPGAVCEIPAFDQVSSLQLITGHGAKQYGGIRAQINQPLHQFFTFSPVAPHREVFGIIDRQQFIQRIQRHRFFKHLAFFRVPALIPHQTGQPQLCRHVILIQLYGLAQGRLGCVHLANLPSCKTQRGKCLLRLGVNLQRFYYHRFCFTGGLHRADVAIDRQQQPGIRHGRIGRSKTGVMLQGCSEQFNGSLQFTRCAPPPVNTSSPVGLRCCETVRPPNERRRKTGKRFDQCGRNVMGHFVLNLEYVRQFAIVSLRPDMITILDVNQLRGQADPVANFAHAALE